MRPVVKFFLKRELKQARVKRDVERATLIEQVLADEDLFEFVAASAEEEYQYARRLHGAEELDGSVGGVFQDFLKYLFDNRESIFKTILAIIQLLAIL